MFYTLLWKPLEELILFIGGSQLLMIKKTRKEKEAVSKTKAEWEKQERDLRMIRILYY